MKRETNLTGEWLGWSCKREGCEEPVVYSGMGRRPDYCSVRCRREAQRVRREGKRCERCGREFRPLRWGAKWCRPACRQAAYRERQRASR